MGGVNGKEGSPGEYDGDYMLPDTFKRARTQYARVSTNVPGAAVRQPAQLCVDADECAGADADAARGGIGTTPCFRAPWFARGDARERLVLLKAQRFLIKIYCELQFKGFVNLQTTDFSTPSVAFAVRGHPLQDPVGTLVHTLLLLRLVRPPAEGGTGAGARVVCEMAKGADRASPTSVFETTLDASDARCAPGEKQRVELGRQYRMAMMSMLTVVHKFTTNPPHYKDLNLTVEMLYDFLMHVEKPTWQRDIDALQDELRGNEMQLVQNFSIWRIISDSPLAHAEEAMQNLQDARDINADMHLCLRGAIPYFILACMLNPSVDVFETLSEHLTTREIGQALCFSAFATAQIVYAHGPAERRRTLSCATQAAVGTILENALASHATWLRTVPQSPYMMLFEGDASGALPLERRSATIVQPHALRIARDIYADAD
jgi:hypothetical protein